MRAAGDKFVAVLVMPHGEIAVVMACNMTSSCSIASSLCCVAKVWVRSSADILCCRTVSVHGQGKVAVGRGRGRRDSLT